MSPQECKDAAAKTNALLEQINIRLASINLIFYGNDPVTHFVDMQQIIAAIKATKQ